MRSLTRVGVDTQGMTEAPYWSVCDQARPDLGPGETFTVRHPLRGRTWTDDAGVVWRRRGLGALLPRQARKALTRPDVQVMHVHLGHPHLHIGASLEGLLGEIERVWRGDDDHGHHTFDIGEFRDDSHRSMVMVVEGC